MKSHLLACIPLFLAGACSGTTESVEPDPLVVDIEAPEVVTDALAMAGPYPAKVRIVCAIVGEASRVTIGKYDEDLKYHGAFKVSPELKRLIDVPERSVNFGSKPALDQCFTQAQQLVIDELPATWTIVKAEGITGHCWRGGYWQPCVPGTGANQDPFDTYAFPLHIGGAGGTKHFEWAKLIDPATNIEQKIDMIFYVVVHADVP
jgi:hypothetical protein